MAFLSAISEWRKKLEEAGTLTLESSNIATKTLQR